MSSWVQTSSRNIFHLKYVKEVRPGGMIASSYDLEGLQSNHQISSDGEVNAQALVTSQEFKHENEEEQKWLIKDNWLI